MPKLSKNKINRYAEELNERIMSFFDEIVEDIEVLDWDDFDEILERAVTIADTMEKDKRYDV